MRKKQVIYAFEVMNEPWWCIAPLTDVFGRALEKSDLLTFLSDCNQAIQQRGLKSTVGHRYLRNIHGSFSSVRDELPQHHYYADWLLGDQLMSRSAGPKTAKILGEFASVSPNEYGTLKREYQKRTRDLLKQARDEPDPIRKQQSYASAELLKDELSKLHIQKKLWAKVSRVDNDRERVVEIRLHSARQRGYELALIWPDQIDPHTPWIDNLKLSTTKLQSVKRFLSRH